MNQSILAHNFLRFLHGTSTSFISSTSSLLGQLLVYLCSGFGFWCLFVTLFSPFWAGSTRYRVGLFLKQISL